MKEGDRSGAKATRIVCVLLPRFNMMTLVSLLEPTRVANYLSAAPLYAASYCCVEGDVMTASNGMQVPCENLPEKVDRDSYVFVFGSWGAEHYANPKLLSWLRRTSRMGIRICGVEIAAYVLARAGLLEGRKATTHWSYLAGLQEAFPSVFATEQLFTSDGTVMTCAGGTAPIDLMLHLIEEDHGAALRGEISDTVLHGALRPAETPQRESRGRGLAPLPKVVRDGIALIESHISEPLSVPEVARRLGLSQRQLERVFKQALGCSVVQFGLLLRLQHARVLLTSTDLSVRDISAASGFNSLSHFAYAFRKCFAKRPSEYRHAWPDEDAAPSWPGSLARYLETLDATRSRVGH